MQTKLQPVIRDVCGTTKGYARHRSKNESFCEPCQTAMREHRRLSYKKWNANSKKYRDKWYADNKDRIREKRNEYSRRYVKENAEYYRNKCRKRRALKRNNGYSPYTEAQVLDLYGTNCHICGIPIDLSIPRTVGYPGWEQGLHIDHVIPIANGGPDTIDNVRPAHGLCNISKGAKMTNEFEPELDEDLFDEDFNDEDFEDEEYDFDEDELEEEDTDEE